MVYNQKIIIKKQQKSKIYCPHLMMTLWDSSWWWWFFFSLLPPLLILIFFSGFTHSIFFSLLTLLIFLHTTILALLWNRGSESERESAVCVYISLLFWFQNDDDDWSVSIVVVVVDDCVCVVCMANSVGSIRSESSASYSLSSHIQTSPKTKSFHHLYRVNERRESIYWAPGLFFYILLSDGSHSTTNQTSSFSKQRKAGSGLLSKPDRKLFLFHIYNRKREYLLLPLINIEIMILYDHARAIQNPNNWREYS